MMFTFFRCMGLHCPGKAVVRIIRWPAKPSRRYLCQMFDGLSSAASIYNIGLSQINHVVTRICLLSVGEKYFSHSSALHTGNFLLKNEKKNSTVSENKTIFRNGKKKVVSVSFFKFGNQKEKFQKLGRKIANKKLFFITNRRR